MVYIIMCGGNYEEWETPKQMTEVSGEPIVARTIRLLREAGVDDIRISSNNPAFNQFGLPVLHHQNGYRAYASGDFNGYWADAFYPMNEPVCYIFGDVVFSPEAIRTIVETDTDTIEFFASAPPFAEEYPKPWAEPFALKVVDHGRLRAAINEVKRLYHEGKYARKPIMWELWTEITGGTINAIDYNSYVVINDYTCDIDYPEDAYEFGGIV